MTDTKKENGKSSPLSVNVGYLDLVGQISLLNATFWPCSDMPIEKYEVFFTLEVKKTGLQVFYLILRLSFQLFFQRPAFEEEKVKEKMRSFSGFLFCCWVLLFVLEHLFSKSAICSFSRYCRNVIFCQIQKSLLHIFENCFFFLETKLWRNFFSFT